MAVVGPFVDALHGTNGVSNDDHDQNERVAEGKEAESLDQPERAENKELEDANEEGGNAGGHRDALAEEKEDKATVVEEESKGGGRGGASAVEPASAKVEPSESSVVASPSSQASASPSPAVGLSPVLAESKDAAGGKSSVKVKQSLGAFHHLAPMRKPSALQSRLGEIRSGMGGDAPWDPFGKPILGKKEFKKE